jgi:O-acetyl-ADP-ribose deacetylase (regulator of RNase III)
MEGRKLAIKMRTTSLEIVDIDITDVEEIDVLVNAASADLQLGTGVAGAILAKGGDSIQEECNRIGGTLVGTAVMTGPGLLAVRHIVHAVGPRMGEGEEDRKLASAVRSALALTERHGMKSLALPAISSGSFGFPMDRCARITLTEVQRYIQGGTKLERIVIAVRGEDNFEIFKRELRRGFR